MLLFSFWQNHCRQEGHSFWSSRRSFSWAMNEGSSKVSWGRHLLRALLVFPMRKSASASCKLGCRGPQDSLYCGCHARGDGWCLTGGAQTMTVVLLFPECTRRRVALESAKYDWIVPVPLLNGLKVVLNVSHLLAGES